jgi:rRNA maturation endonuclease Nob1
MQYLNKYRCPECKEEWEDVWDAMSNDECPKCGIHEIEPYESEEVDEE